MLHTCTCKCTYTHIQTWSYIYAHSHTHMRVQTHVHVHICMIIHMHIHMLPNVNVNVIYVNIYKCTFGSLPVCTCTQPRTSMCSHWNGCIPCLQSPCISCLMTKPPATFTRLYTNTRMTPSRPPSPPPPTRKWQCI